MEMQPERFKAIRKRLGLNQAELGEKLGLSLGWISKMELGQAPIEPRTALAMLYLEGHSDVGRKSDVLAKS